MLYRVFLLGLFTLCSLHATEEFTLVSMKKYLTKENPYVYSALANKYITQEKLTYVQGAYDTKIVAKYDEKDYPSIITLRQQQLDCQVSESHNLAGSNISKIS